jgi:glycosyltransferase involved in cell wall biosynthesis
MPDPLVSVIVPAYNHEAYVQQTLDSIEAQTYPNIEVVIVNDGSRDRTGEVCKAFCARSRRRTVYLEQANAGITKTVAAGYRASSGELVSFLASDDWLFRDKIAVQVQDLLEHDCDAVYGNIVNVRPDNIYEVYDGAVESGDNWDPEAFIDGLVTAHGPMLQAGLFRRSILEAIGGVDHGVEQEDWPIHIKVARAARRVRTHAEPVVYYRHHAGNTVRTKRVNLMRWKVAIVREHCTGRTRRHGIASAHRILAVEVLMRQPFFSLRHYLVSMAYDPKLHWFRIYLRRLFGQALPDWAWRKLHPRQARQQAKA